MAFPATPLDVRVDLSISGVWTDVSALVYVRDAITITRGRPDESSSFDPATASLTLNNRDGRFSPRNPTSPYYSILGRNTPIRIGVGRPPVGAGSALAAPGTSHAAPSVDAEVAGRLFCVWAASSVGNYTGPAGFTMNTERDGAAATMGSGHKSVSAGATGTSVATFSVSPAHAATCSIFIPGVTSSPVGTFVDTDGFTFTYTPDEGEFLLATHVFSSDPDGEMDSIVPQDLDVAGAGWMLLADTGASPGPRIRAFLRRAEFTGTHRVHFVGSARGSSVSNFCVGYEIVGAEDYRPRFHGEVPSWPTRWDLSGKDVYTPIEASGVLRRLSQGAPVSNSAMARHFLSIADVVAYWPMEDESDAKSFSSALNGRAPLTFFGATPTLGADEAVLGSAPLPTFTGAGASGEIAPHADTGEIFFGALCLIPAGGTADQAVLFSVAGTGSIARWDIRRDSGSDGVVLQARDRDNNLVLSEVRNLGLAGFKWFLYMDALQNGANVSWRFWGILASDENDDVPLAATSTGSITGQSIGVLRHFSVGSAALTNNVVLGHAVAANRRDLFYGVNSGGDFESLRSITGWRGESAADRIRRLTREERVAYSSGFEPVSPKMGPQRPGAFLDLIAGCEGVDGGVLYEPRGMLALALRPATTLGNQQGV